LQFFGVPRHTRAIELIDPIARRSVGYIVPDREPVSPIARNLLAIQLLSDMIALITPPLKPETPR
jgi:hypothetical protein